MLVSQQGGPPARELHPCAHHSPMLPDWPVSLEPARSTHHSALQKYHDPRVTGPWPLHSIALHPWPQPGLGNTIKVFANTDGRSNIGRAACTNAPRSSGVNRIGGLDGKGNTSRPIFSPFFSFFSFFHWPSGLQLISMFHGVGGSQNRYLRHMPVNTCRHAQPPRFIPLLVLSHNMNLERCRVGAEPEKQFSKVFW